jgi:hypothetical protein
MVFKKCLTKTFTCKNNNLKCESDRYSLINTRFLDFFIPFIEQ